MIRCDMHYLKACFKSCMMWQSCVCFADCRGTKRTYLCVSVFAWMVSSYIWTVRRFSTVLWGKAHFSFFFPWPESCLCKWKSVECLGMLICVFFPSSLSWTEARVIPEGGTVLKYLNTFIHISLPERKSKINKSVTMHICIFVILSSVNTKSITVLKGKGILRTSWRCNIPHPRVSPPLGWSEQSSFDCWDFCFFTDTSRGKFQSCRFQKITNLIILENNKKKLVWILYIITVANTSKLKASWLDSLGFSRFTKILQKYLERKQRESYNNLKNEFNVSQK